MRLISNEELLVVAGGDAAATRQPGQNSWGESVDPGTVFTHGDSEDEPWYIS